MKTKNRIDELIKLGMEDPAAFDKAILALAERSKEDKKLKADLRREFQESLNKKGKQINELTVK